MSSANACDTLPTELADYQPVFATLSRATSVGLDVPTQVVVRVNQVLSPEAHDGQLLHRVCLGGQEGRDVETAPFARPELLEMASWAQRRGVLAIAKGSFVAAGKERPGGRGARVEFRLEGLQPMTQVLNLLGPSIDEVAMTSGLVEALRQTPGGIYDHLFGTFCREFSIAADSLSQRQRTALRLVALQAVSDGQLPGQDHNPRLSIMVSSAPARGKKLMVQFAGALAPAFEWIQPAESSLAGIMAVVTQRKGGYYVTPGAIVRGNKGTVALDDMHRVPRQQQHQLEGGLMAIAEDGRLTLTKAGSAHFDAQCALLLTGNPASTLPGMSKRRRPRGGEGIAAERADDLGLPLDLLSRIDVLLWLDGDVDPLDSAQEMAARPATVPPPRGPTERPALRQIKLMAAYLRDRFPVVDLDGVADALRRAMREVGAVLREYMAKQESGLELDSLARRISNSLRKLTGAAARLEGRGVATEADVDEAFRMLMLKMEMLRWLAGDVPQVRPLLPRVELVARAEQQRDLRQEDLRRRFGGQRQPSKAMAEALGLKERLVRRELWSMGLEEVRGHWAVPTQLEYQRAQEQRARDAAFAKAEDATIDARAAAGNRDAQVARRLRMIKDEEFAWEETLPGLPKFTFYDCVPRLPARLEPYVATMRNIHRDEQETLQVELCQMTTMEHNSNWLPVLGRMYERVPFYEGYPIAHELQEDLNALLFHEDWATRGLWALALLWELPLGDDDMLSRYLRLQLKLAEGRGVRPPDRLREGIEAFCVRLDQRDRARAAAAECRLS